MSNEFGYIPEAPEQSYKNNSGIFTPTDIYNLTLDNKWTTVGQLELISTQSYSSAVGFVDFKVGDGTFDTSYDVHFMTLNNIGMSTGNFNQPSLRFYESDVLESGTVYHYARLDGFYNATTQQSRDTDDTGFKLMVDNSTDTARSRNVGLYLYNLGDPSKHSFCTFIGSSIRSNTQVRYSFGGGVLPQLSTVDGIRIYPSAGGNFSSYDMSLYGLRFQ